MTGLTGSDALDGYAAHAADNLWMHFTRHSAYATDPVSVVARAQGCWLETTTGHRVFDGLSGLFATQIGHGRPELADAAAAQMRELDYFPLWSHAHPRAIELAQRLTAGAPRGLSRVFFATTGSEAVETAWKIAKQYFKLTGKPLKHKVISRAISYHGTTHGALSITGIPFAKQYFEPLVPSTVRVPNTNLYRAPDELREDPAAFGRWAADRIEEAILMEGPDTVAAVFLEPVQNAGGAFPPPPGYLERVREICTRYDVLLVADEVITGFGRIGGMFASNHFGLVPDMLTCAKGMTSGYAPIAACLVQERIFAPFAEGTSMLAHGFTWGGHPVSAAVALANMDILEGEGIYDRVRSESGALRERLDSLRDLPIVGDVRGDGFFFALELVRDADTRETFTDEEAEKLLRGFLSPELWAQGLYCRADDRGDPVIMLAPPLVATSDELDHMTDVLRRVLSDASRLRSHQA